MISTTVTLAAVFVPILFLRGPDRAAVPRVRRGRGGRGAGLGVRRAHALADDVPLPARARSRATARFYRATRALLRRARRAATGARSARSWRARWLALPRSSPARSRSSRSAGALLPSELAPLEDRSNIRVNVRAPGGRVVRVHAVPDGPDRALPRATTVPEIARALRDRGARLGGGAVEHRALQPLPEASPSERERSAGGGLPAGRADLERLHRRARASPRSRRRSATGASGQPVQYVLQAPHARGAARGAARVPRGGEREPGAALRRRRPEGEPARGLRSASTARRAAELGVSVHDVARTLQLAYGGQRFGYFLQNDRQYDVIGQVERGDRNEPARPREPLRARARRRDDLARQPGALRRDASGPAAIYRFNRFTSATISAGLAPGTTLGDGDRRARRDRARERAAARRSAPASRASRATSPTPARACSSRSRFALVLIYLMLAAQFESFRDPLIILVTVPLSIAGALARARCSSARR